MQTTNPVYEWMRDDAKALEVAKRLEAAALAKATRAALQKGDAPGHPFRGNQHTDGEGGGSVARPSMADDVTDLTKISDGSNQHISRGTITNLRDHLREDGRPAEFFSEGSDTHAEFVQTDMLLRASGFLGRPTTSSAEESVYEYAHQYDGRTARVVSSFGDATSIKVQIGRLGKYAAAEDLTKGDSPGHPFRGNQHTDGEGGGGDSTGGNKVDVEHAANVAQSVSPKGAKASTNYQTHASYRATLDTDSDATKATSEVQTKLKALGFKEGKLKQDGDYTDQKFKHPNGSVATITTSKGSTTPNGTVYKPFVEVSTTAKDKSDGDKLSRAPSRLYGRG